MESQKTVEIVLVSGACCAPSLAQVEKELEERLKQTIQELSLDAKVTVVSLSSVLSGKASVAEDQAQLIQALFQKYGARFAPAGLVDKRVLFAGGAPAPDKLKTALEGL